MLVGGIFCELEKACDCVNLVLLSTLEFDGILGNLNALNQILFEWQISKRTNKHQNVVTPYFFWLG